MADIEIDSVYEGIASQLDKILNAKYGDDVRTAIVTSLTMIAQKIDTEIGNLSTIVESAATTIEDNATQYAHYAALVSEAEEKATNLTDAKNAIMNALSKITNIDTKVIPYKKFESGAADPQYGFDSDVPRLEYLADSSSWRLHFPRVPQFKTIRVNRLQYSKFSTNPEAFKDSVNYDPNTGVLTVNVIDPLSRLSVKTKIVKYNDAQFGNANAIPVDLTYNGNVPTIVLTVPHGQNGGGSNKLNYRPYFEKVIWENYNYKDPTSATFPECAILTGAYHTTVNQKYTLGGYSLSGAATPPLDAVIIRFRKSVNNTSASEFTLANTMGASLAFKNNSDYDNEYSLFLPRGCCFRMTVFDVEGRKISRPVYWIGDGTSYSRIIWGGSRTAAPKWLFGRTSDMAAKLSSLTGDNVTRQATLKNYTAGLLFGNATVDDDGDLVDHAWWDAGTYNMTQHVKTSAGTWWNPAANQSKNNAYNQFLIPISITGVWYQLLETEIFNFPGNNV